MTTYDPIQSACLKLDRMCAYLEREIERCNEKQKQIEMMKRFGLNSLPSDSVPIRKVTGVNV